jgi:ribosomal protein S18 acetylase RimI-like enzyme
MQIVIEEVSNKKQLRDFIDLPYSLYKGHAQYVPPLRFDEAATLNKEKNPAFDYCDARYWVAYRNNKPVGRIAAICNNLFNDKWEKKYLRFGWFDFEEDEQVASVLLKQVEDWGRELDMQAVHGPLGFTDLDHEGMLIEGFEHLGTMAAGYNYSYYPNFIEKLGYQKDTDWLEFRVNVPAHLDEKLEKLASMVSRRYGLTGRRFKKSKEVLPYAGAIFDLINEAYSDLYGVVPLTKKQHEYYTKQYFSFMRPDFISLVTDKEDKVVAFGITMPSLSKALQKSGGKLFPIGFLHLLRAMKKNNTADLLMVAVNKHYQGKGVNAILMNETLKSYVKNGIRHVETNHQLEDNGKVQSMFDYFEKVQHKRRRCYIKHLDT